MPQGQSDWALVLAAGEGSRLRALTTKPCGTAVPKQYCSLRGGRSLLEDALARAAKLVPAHRVCTIVAQQHRPWWSESAALLDSSERGNLIVQPRNLGTGIGILYSLLHILAKDPRAHVVLLPADHYIRDEHVLNQALMQAFERVRKGADRPVLLGLQPEETDTELGYILPGARDPRGGHEVARFIEKPDFSVASEIIAAGGLWNTFIMVAAARTLLDMYLPRFAPLVMEMQLIISRGMIAGSPTASWPAILGLYQRLPELDFSRDLLEINAAKLCVMSAPACGWSDLGTPRRVGETLRRLRSEDRHTHSPPAPAHINLAAQHAHFVRSQVSARM